MRSKMCHRPASRSRGIMDRLIHEVLLLRSPNLEARHALAAAQLRGLTSKRQLMLDLIPLCHLPGAHFRNLCPAQGFLLQLLMLAELSQRLSHFIHASHQAPEGRIRLGDFPAAGQLAKLPHQATHIQHVVSWPGRLFGNSFLRSLRRDLCRSRGLARTSGLCLIVAFRQLRFAVIVLWIEFPSTWKRSDA